MVKTLQMGNSPVSEISVPVPPAPAPIQKIEPSLPKEDVLPFIKLDPSLTGHLIEKTSKSKIMKIILDGKPCVAKEVKYSQSAVKSFNSQYRVIKNLDSRWFIKYDGIGITKNYIYLIQDLVPGVILHKWLIKNRKKEEKVLKIRNVIGEILLGLQYLSDRGLAHLDISSGNIMVDGETIKFIDYDTMDNAHGIYTQILSTFPAPEVELNNRNYNKRSISVDKSDVFSLGMCLYICLNNSYPYMFDRPEDYLRLREWLCLFPTYPDEWKAVPFVYPTDKLIEKLVNLMIVPKAKERLTAGELYKLLMAKEDK